MYSVDGPWTREEEDDLLKHYGLKPMPGLEGSYRYDGPDGPDGGVGIFGREEALENIKRIRRAAYGGGPGRPEGAA